MLFSEELPFELTAEKGEHLLMGQESRKIVK